MHRTPVNPSPWSLNFGYSQAHLITNPGKFLIVSGQTSVDDQGNPMHAGDMRSQLIQSMDNLQAVLTEAGMGLSNIVKLGIFATDVDAALASFDILGQRMGPTGVAPAMTLLGVTRLALPPLMIEIEATAVA